MNIENAKRLLQNLLFTTKDNKLTKKDIMDKYPDLVVKSRDANKDGIQLYRVIKVLPDGEIKDFNSSESTTTSMKCAIDVASSMPAALSTDDGMKKLETHIFSFELPTKNILLDINVVLPLLKDKLKNQMNRTIISDRYGRRMKIEDIFEEIEYANEKEILADLRNVDNIHLNVKDEASFSFSCNLSHLEKGFDKIGYPEDLAEQYKTFKSVLSSKDKKLIEEFAIKNEIPLQKKSHSKNSINNKSLKI